MTRIVFLCVLTLAAASARLSALAADDDPPLTEEETIRRNKKLATLVPEASPDAVDAPGAAVAPRRSRRRAGARAASGAGPAQDDESAEAPSDASGGDSHTTAIRSRAKGLGEDLLRGMNADAGAGSLSPGAPGGAAPKPASAGPSPAAFLNPKSAADFETAKSAGYDAPFERLGLKPIRDRDGRAAITRADGSPAGESDLAELRRLIALEPAALAARPDFFRVLPREHFESLRRDYQARPELRAGALKDVGATDGARDFVWDASCSALSGGCNRNTDQQSYSKGKFVTPGDLERMYKDSAGDAPSPAKTADFWAAYGKEDGLNKEASTRQEGALAALKARMRALLGSLGMGFGAEGEAGAGAVTSATSASVGFVRPESDGAARERVAMSTAAAARAGASPPAPPASISGGSSRRPWYLAALALLLVALGARRLREP